MNLTLHRNRADAYGVFGVLDDELGFQVAVTLEHAYQQPDGSFAPKIPAGEYSCFRGQHKLSDMAKTFETFEVVGVPGHAGILFHKGNYQKDSSGCILLGSQLGAGCILESGTAFGHFLDLQVGHDSFQLVVLDPI